MRAGDEWPIDIETGREKGGAGGGMLTCRAWQISSSVCCPIGSRFDLNTRERTHTGPSLAGRTANRKNTYIGGAYIFFGELPG